MDHHSSFADFEPLFENRSGWRRLYPDLPGMGQTPGADWIKRHDDMLEVVLGFLDAVAPGERFVVAGTSYGAYLAPGLMQYRQSQMDGLLMLVPAIDSDPETRVLPAHQVIAESAEFQAALRPEEQVLRDVLVVQSLEVLEGVRAVLSPALAMADHKFLEQITGAFSFDTHHLPEPFAAPALLVTGRQDSTCGFHAAWRLLNECPRGTLAILDRAGHGLGLEQKTLLRALASEWLDRVEEYAPILTGTRAGHRS
jgi:pimeloyl-ACP methyl ester carboxylesterase